MDVNTWRRISTGEIIDIKDMHDDHLLNTMKKVHRDNPTPLNEIPGYDKLLSEAITRKLLEGDIGEWDAEENI